jgi:DNA-directed RNA polymerase subunit alpha
MTLRDKSVTELGLSVRSKRHLKDANIRTLGELVAKTEAELLHSKHFGEKSIYEIREVLAEHGLRLGMGGDEDVGLSNGR